MHASELLIHTYAHIPPARALEELTSAQAEQRLAGANHSIAELVAHAGFWQNWFCDRCDGTAAPMPSPAAIGWPPVESGAWPDVLGEFRKGLERAAAMSDRAHEPIAPAIEFTPLGQYTIGDAIVHIAQHNSHHLGQVILLRQLMGLWPPPAGSWTW